MSEDHLERIRERAHAIWEQQGRPEGLAEAHWHQASAEVSSARRKKAAAATAMTTTKRGKVPTKERTPA